MGDVSILDDLSHIYRLGFLPDWSSMRICVAISQFSTEKKSNKSVNVKKEIYKKSQEKTSDNSRFSSANSTLL